MPPNASGVTNSVARTSPKRSTTVSQTIEERSQCFAAPSGNGKGLPARSVRGRRGASRTALLGSRLGHRAEI